MHAHVRYTALTPGMPMRMNRFRFLGEAAGGDGTAGAGAGPVDAAAAAQTATDAAAATAAAATAQATADAAAATEATNIQGLPEWAQKVIRDTRTEAGTYRTKATDAATKATADATASQSTLDKIAIALGLKTGDDAPDAAALTAQVTAAQDGARTAQVELAVFKAAGAAGANAVALLDRNSFTKTVAGLDPTAADFSSKVTAAITAAVTADPTLKQVLAAGASSVEHAGGTGEQRTRTPMSLTDAVTSHYKA